MSWVSASPKSSPKRLVDNEGNVAIDRTNFGPPGMKTLLSFISLLFICYLFMFF